MRSLYRRRMRLALGLWCVAWLGIAIALFVPHRSGMIGRADLLIHFLTFGCMAFGAVGFSRNPAQLVLCSFLTIVISLLFELAQGFVLHRSADPLDGLANMLGAATGAAVALATWQTWMRPAAPQDPPVEFWAGRDTLSHQPIGSPDRRRDPLQEQQYDSPIARRFGGQPSRTALAAASDSDRYRATKAAQLSARRAYSRWRNADLSPPA